MPATNGDEAKPKDREREDRERRKGNYFLLLAAVLFIAAAWWLVDAMIAARKADECISAGRRNCAPLNTPADGSTR